MIKLIQRILDERKARKREEYLNEWKAKESDLYKKMEYFRELARENESRLGLCITMTWAEEMLILLLLAVIGANSESTKKELEKLGFEPEKIFIGDPWGLRHPPRRTGELRTEIEVENGRGFDSRFCSE